MQNNTKLKTDAFDTRRPSRVAADEAEAAKAPFDTSRYTVTVTFMVEASNHKEAIDIVEDSIDDRAPFLRGVLTGFNIDAVQEA